ncbi:hypothetical protein O0L34_g5727 [Tuta absoluta]|nr:hypothetical protein O0L34_g5727 [Tuta absoluta]
MDVNTESGNSEDMKKKGIDLDTILVEELGQFGKYQLKTLLLLAVAMLLSGWQAEYIFTAARINTRCLIPECDGNMESPDFSPSWLLNAVNGTSSTDFDNCHRFLNTSSGVDPNGTCPAGIFDRDITIPCEEYVYEHTDSVVFDYDLGCDEWRRSLIGSIRTVGTLVALPITGFVSDRWGRRTALALNAFNTGWIGLTRYWARTYVGFVISQFAEAAFGSGIVSCVFILLLELVGPKYRVVVGVTMNTCFAIGQVTLGAIAWAFPNWQKLTLALYIPQLFTIVYFWLLGESIRWYMSKGRYEKAQSILQEVARVNKTQLSENSLHQLKLNVEEERKMQALEKQQQASEPWLVLLVFRTRPILIRCIVSPVWWITTTFIYYGLSINSVNLSGNPYVSYMAVSAIEIPGYMIASVLLGRVGRKPVLAGSFWICAACQIAYLFLPHGMDSALLAVYLVGKFSISMVVAAIYVYTPELYPTRYRHRLFAFSSMVGRIGSITAPLTPAFGDQLPFILFGCLALVAGLLVLVTPETLGAKFPDTMEEAANMSRTT